MYLRKKTIYVSFFALFLLSILSMASFGLLLSENNELSQQIMVKGTNGFIPERKAIRLDEQDHDLLSFQVKMMNSKYPLYAQVVKMIYKKSREHLVDPSLVMSIVETESSCNPYAVSSAGAYGLMQINYSIWKDELGINHQKIFDMEYNLDLGIKILQHYLHISKNDMQKALHYYNNGFSLTNYDYAAKVIRTVVH